MQKNLNIPYLWARVLTLQAYVRLTDCSQRLLNNLDFHFFFTPWSYMMKVIAEVHRVHLIRYLRFIIIAEKRGICTRSSDLFTFHLFHDSCWVRLFIASLKSFSNCRNNYSEKFENSFCWAPWWTRYNYIECFHNYIFFIDFHYYFDMQYL